MITVDERYRQKYAPTNPLDRGSSLTQSDSGPDGHFKVVVSMFLGLLSESPDVVLNSLDIFQSLFRNSSDDVFDLGGGKKERFGRPFVELFGVLSDSRITVGFDVIDDTFDDTWLRYVSGRVIELSDRSDHADESIPAQRNLPGTSRVVAKPLPSVWTGSTSLRYFLTIVDEVVW